MENDALNLARLTHDQPFCAGVILLQEDTLVITVNSDGIAEELSAPCWRLGGVGGGQAIGETIWECAKREACEEIGTEVEVLHSPVTYFHDIDSRVIREVQIYCYFSEK